MLIRYRREKKTCHVIHGEQFDVHTLPNLSSIWVGNVVTGNPVSKISLGALLPLISTCEKIADPFLAKSKISSHTAMKIADEMREKNEK